MTLKSIQHSIDRFLSRFHVMLFSVIIMGSIAIAILMLYGVVQRSTKTEGATPTSSTTLNFDEETIKKVDQLNQSDTPTDYVPPPGRINPFVE